MMKLVKGMIPRLSLECSYLRVWNTVQWYLCTHLSARVFVFLCQHEVRCLWMSLDFIYQQLCVSPCKHPACKGCDPPACCLPARHAVCQSAPMLAPWDEQANKGGIPYTNSTRALMEGGVNSDKIMLSLESREWCEDHSQPCTLLLSGAIVGARKGCNQFISCQLWKCPSLSCRHSNRAEAHKHKVQCVNPHSLTSHSPLWLLSISLSRGRRGESPAHPWVPPW